MRYTFGGIPGSDALYWDDTTKRQLGDIVFLLLSGFPEKRMKAYQQWYELKRRFMVEEWERYIAELDTYRIQNNHRPVVEMIEEAVREVVKYNKPLPKEPEKDPIVMVPKTAEVWAPEPEKKVVKKKENDLQINCLDVLFNI